MFTWALSTSWSWGLLYFTDIIASKFSMLDCLCAIFHVIHFFQHFMISFLPFLLFTNLLDS